MRVNSIVGTSSLFWLFPSLELGYLCFGAERGSHSPAEDGRRVPGPFSPKAAPRYSGPPFLCGGSAESYRSPSVVLLRSRAQSACSKRSVEPTSSPRTEQTFEVRAGLQLQPACWSQAAHL